MSPRQALIEKLTENQREVYEERAAICEHLGEMTKRGAEAMAWLDVQRQIQRGELP